MNNQKAAFLDRDGVINVNYGYVSKAEDITFFPGVFEATKKLQDAGYQIFVITNQSGIGRGYYSEAEFHQLTSWITKQFQQHGVTISDTAFCPHHPEKAHPPYLQVCHCRKPAPGMINQLSEQYKVDKHQSVLFGDKLSDIKAAENAGLGFAWLIDSVDPTLNVDDTVEKIRPSLNALKYKTRADSLLSAVNQFIRSSHKPE